jgi:hypothetical protein
LYSKLVLNHFTANCSKNDPHDFVLGVCFTEKSE